jgi:hypothetical protein
MADLITFFMAPEDEVAFFRALEPMGFSIVPEIVPPGVTPIPVSAAVAGELEGESYYLAAEALAPIEVRPIKRGPNRGSFEIDEIRSPVIHYERSVREGEELRSGRIWAELVVSGDTRENLGKSEAFRQLFERVRAYLKRFRRSQPVGVWIGPAAARLASTGVRLREAGRKGELFRPFR